MVLEILGYGGIYNLARKMTNIIPKLNKIVYTQFCLMRNLPKDNENCQKIHYFYHRGLFIYEEVYFYVRCRIIKNSGRNLF